MPKRKSETSELVRETAGHVIYWLTRQDMRTDQLIEITSARRITVHRAIQHIREQGVCVLWDKRRGFHLRREDRAELSQLGSLNVHALARRPENRGRAWCLALEATA